MTPITAIDERNRRHHTIPTSWHLHRINSTNQAVQTIRRLDEHSDHTIRRLLTVTEDTEKAQLIVISALFPLLAGRIKSSPKPQAQVLSELALAVAQATRAPLPANRYASNVLIDRAHHKLTRPTWAEQITRPQYDPAAVERGCDDPSYRAIEDHITLTALGLDPEGVTRIITLTNLPRPLTSTETSQLWRQRNKLRPILEAKNIRPSTRRQVALTKE